MVHTRQGDTSAISYLNPYCQLLKHLRDGRKILKLDIGCGNKPTGDVNCDLFIGKTPHLDKDAEINPKIIANFVKCDANNLPFRDKCFDHSYCSHVIEHRGLSPIKVIGEMTRVTNGIIEVLVPHRFARWKSGKFARLKWVRYKQHAYHACLFNIATLTQLFQRLNLNPEITVQYQCFPNILFCLIRLPWEITVKAVVK